MRQAWTLSLLFRAADRHRGPLLPFSRSFPLRLERNSHGFFPEHRFHTYRHPYLSRGTPQARRTARRE
jgi:hypothetical protein